MDYKVLLFGYDRRINRAKYWLAWGLWLAASLAVIVTTFLLGILFGPWVSVIILCLTLILGLLGIMSWIAVGLKRLHDRDKSGWWLLLFYLGPAVLDAMGQLAGGGGVIFRLAASAVSIWGLIELGCLPGTAGPNRYGPDPLGDAATQPA